MTDIDLLLREKYAVVRRTVEADDAEFITKLRSDSSLNLHIHACDGRVEGQREWIRRYKEREACNKEYYFIFENRDGVKYGTTRISDILNDTYVFGSWLFSKETPPFIPILADISSRDFAFNKLGCSTCLFNINKANTEVVRYNRMFPVEVVGENDVEYMFSITKDEYFKGRAALLKRYRIIK